MINTYGAVYEYLEEDNQLTIKKKNVQSENMLYDTDANIDIMKENGVLPPEVDESNYDEWALAKVRTEYPEAFTLKCYDTKIKDRSDYSGNVDKYYGNITEKELRYVYDGEISVYSFSEKGQIIKRENKYRLSPDEDYGSASVDEYAYDEFGNLNKWNDFEFEYANLKDLYAEYMGVDVSEDEEESTEEATTEAVAEPTDNNTDGWKEAYISKINNFMTDKDSSDGYVEPMGYELINMDNSGIPWLVIFSSGGWLIYDTYTYKDNKLSGGMIYIYVSALGPPLVQTYIERKSIYVEKYFATYTTYETLYDVSQYEENIDGSTKKWLHKPLLSINTDVSTKDSIPRYYKYDGETEIEIQESEYNKLYQQYTEGAPEKNIEATKTKEEIIAEIENY